MRSRRGGLPGVSVPRRGQLRAWLPDPPLPGPPRLRAARSRAAPPQAAKPRAASPRG